MAKIYVPQDWTEEDGKYILKKSECYPGTSIEIRPCQGKPGRFSIFIINLETKQESRLEHVTRGCRWKDRSVRYDFAITTCWQKAKTHASQDWWLLKVGIDTPITSLDIEWEKSAYPQNRIDYAEKWH